MAYPLQQLQHTAQYIANQCEYLDGGRLTHTTNKWVYREILSALNILKLRDTNVMIVHLSNTALSELFDTLEKEYNVEFPANRTYILKRNGQSTEKIVHSSISKDEQAVLFARIMVDKCTNKKGQALNEVQEQFVYEAFKETIEELMALKKAKIVIDPNQRDLKDLFAQLKGQGVVFPDAKFILKRTGECVERTRAGDQIIFAPDVENNEIYNWAESRHKSSRAKRLSQMLESDEGSASDEDVDVLTKKFAQTTMYDRFKSRDNSSVEEQPRAHGLKRDDSKHKFI